MAKSTNEDEAPGELVRIGSAASPNGSRRKLPKANSTSLRFRRAESLAQNKTSDSRVGNRTSTMSKSIMSRLHSFGVDADELDVDRGGDVSEAGFFRRQKRLEVTVLKGIYLPKSSASTVYGHVNGYISLEYGEHTYNTRPGQRKIDPEWNHTFTLEFLGKGVAIEGFLKDCSKTAKHEVIGKFKIDPQVCETGEEQEIETAVTSPYGQMINCGPGKQTRIMIHIRMAEKTTSIQLPPYKWTLAEYVHQKDIDEMVPPPIQFGHQSGFSIPPTRGEIRDAAEGRGKVAEMRAAEAERRKRLISQQKEDDEVKAILEYMTWKERLANVLSSLQVNIAVLLLVIIDLISILIFEFAVDNDDKDCFSRMFLSEAIITFIVLSFFFIEIALRLIAHELAFFKGAWNVFDFIVVSLSVGLIIWKVESDINNDETKLCFKTIGRQCQWPDIIPRKLTDPRFPGGVTVCSILLQGDGANNEVASDVAKSTKLSRVVSRVAVGLRFIRAFMGMNRARILQGEVVGKLRQTVGGTKRRYLREGFNLDLTYITNRMIAMSTPGFGAHKGYRNDIAHVARFLSLKHYGKFRVYNLCEEHEGNYHPQLLYSQMRRVAFDDHNPPAIKQIFLLCQNAMDYMRDDKRNCIALHCKGGKGRTGVMCCAWLMYTGHRSTAADALELFAYRRTTSYVMGTHRNQTVEGPSQIRYCHYLEAVLYHNIDFASEPPMVLQSVCFPSAPGKPKTHNNLSFLLVCNGVTVFDSAKTMDNDEKLPRIAAGHAFLWIIPPTIVRGDVKVEVYKSKDRSSRSAKVGKQKYEKERKEVWPLCQVVFNTAFHTEELSMTFDKFRVDYSHKDRHHHEFVENFGMSLIFADKDPRGPRCAKTLIVHVARAEHLLSNDINGLSDPQARISVGNAHNQTKYILRNLNPQWDETLELPIHSLPLDLDIVVEDRDLLGEDETIGRGSLRITPSMMGKNIEALKPFEVLLTEPGGGKPGAAGKIFLEVGMRKEVLPDQLWVEHEIQKMHQKRGTPMLCKEGQEILPFGFTGRTVYFIESGMVQVVAKDRMSEEEPVVCDILGRGKVFGVQSFLLAVPVMQHVAYTDCRLRVIEISSIAPWTQPELILFYKELAQSLSESLLRLKAESSRLATRTLQSDNDEALVLEQQQNDLCKIAIRRFQLPKIEKCNYLGQMVETTFNGANFKSRIIFLSSVIIIEPTVFGSEFLDATDEEVIDKRRILRVDMLLPDTSEMMTETEIQEAKAKCLSLEVTLQDPISAYDGVLLGMGRHTNQSLVVTFPNKAAFVKAKHLLEEIAVEWQKRRLLRRPLPDSKYNNSFPFMEGVLDEAMHAGHMYFCRPHQSILGRSKKSLDDASQRSIYFISRGTAKVLDDGGSVAWVVHPGELFGETSFVGNAMDFSLVAGASGCEILLLKGDFLLKKCADDSRFARRLYHSIAIDLAEKVTDLLESQYGQGRRGGW